MMRSAKAAAVAALGHAGEQLLLEGLQPALALPGGHRPAQLVGLAGREAGGDDASCITCSWKIGTPRCAPARRRPPADSSMRSLPCRRFR
jgi:hypothetical protein